LFRDSKRLGSPADLGGVIGSKRGNVTSVETRHAFILGMLGGTGIGLLGSGLALAGYVPGMSCSEVGGFAQQVVEQKSIGVTLNEAVAGLRQSLGPEYGNTQRALEKIIRAIYGTKTLSTATPEEVGAAYERACEVVK
jgi:hypothetical protein